MGCFAFLKRNKEKKLEKKRRAIAARATCNRLSTKRTTTGGVSFGIDFGTRPPTPFRGLTPRPGPKHMSMEERLRACETRRAAMLEEKVLFARQDAKRRAEVLQKKERSGILENLMEVDEGGDVTPRDEGHTAPSPSA